MRLLASIRAKLLASFTIVVLVGFAALLTTYLSHSTVRDAHERTETAAIPLADAADEMEIAALTSALAFTRYVEEGDPAALRASRAASRSFERSLTVARRIVRGREDRAVMTIAAERFALLRQLGTRMIAGRDERDRAVGAIDDDLDGLEDRLDEALSDRAPSRLTDAMLATQSDLSALGGQVGGYVAGGDGEQREEALESLDELRDDVDALRASGATQADRRVASVAAATVGRLRRDVRATLRREDALRAGRIVFEGRRKALVAVLDTRVQRVADAYLHAGQHRAAAASARAQTAGALTLVLLLVAASGAFALLVRTIVGPVRRLIDGTRAVADGQLDHRVDGLHDDELGELGATFNHMVERLQQTTVSKERLERSEAALAEQATTDALTGLANRVLLHDRLEQALRRRRGDDEGVAVLFLDLDEFKAINDAHGHEVGDAVLVAVSNRLRHALRAEDTAGRPVGAVARLGGDEFVVLLERLRSVTDAEIVAQRVLDELVAPVTVGEQVLFLDASIGIAMCDFAPDCTAGELLRDGDTAMYAAKRQGKGRFEVFVPAMRERVVAEAQMSRDLRRAAPDGQLRVFYQPQVDVTTGAVSAVEALVRWQHPERGLLAPDAFIPAAEATGDVIALDDWVLDAACAQLSAWDAAGVPPISLAVNVSARRLVTGDLAATVAASLLRAGIAPSRLEIEITETVAVEHDDVAIDAIERVRALGVQVAIDDFGTGHSALSRLQAFPVDRLKIDRSFVSSLTSATARGSIVDAMLAIGQSLGLRVVAEGVETSDHLLALRSLGCPTAQGYLISRPLPAGELEGLLRTGAVVDADEPAGAVVPAAAAERERLTRTLLAELQRVTGLESTYLTRIDWDEALQEVTHARNAGALEIGEGLEVDWSDSVCRRALEQGVTFTDDVAATFPDSEAGAELGLRTYASVPVRDGEGQITGTLCGASSRPVSLGPTTVAVMQRFADLIAQGVAAPARAGDAGRRA